MIFLAAASEIISVRVEHEVWQLHGGWTDKDKVSRRQETQPSRSIYVSTCVYFSAQSSAMVKLRGGSMSVVTDMSLSPRLTFPITTVFLEAGKSPIMTRNTSVVQIFSVKHILVKQK